LTKDTYGYVRSSTASTDVLRSSQDEHLFSGFADAYDATLGQLHAWVVRAGIKTGMMGLPTREAFLKSIGETGECSQSTGAACNSSHLKMPGIAVKTV